jgi:hypothetical protein
VARRVIGQYWPQTVPYGAGAARAAPRVLSQAAQKDIPAKLAAWRAARNLDRSASVDDARAADPPGWAVLEADIVAIVIGMPLAKLQRFGEGSPGVSSWNTSSRNPTATVIQRSRIPTSASYCDHRKFLRMMTPW